MRSRHASKTRIQEQIFAGVYNNQSLGALPE
jgi:hypothetical protein